MSTHTQTYTQNTRTKAKVERSWKDCNRMPWSCSGASNIKALLFFATGSVFPQKEELDNVNTLAVTKRHKFLCCHRRKWEKEVTKMEKQRKNPHTRKSSVTPFQIKMTLLPNAACNRWSTTSELRANQISVKETKSEGCAVAACPAQQPNYWNTASAHNRWSKSDVQSLFF